jgi:8-oxo-dGTP pyrophosphatase MutT (NUDIX family)
MSESAATADPPTPVREAVSLILLRDTRGGMQTFMLRRVPAMAFGAGMSVFPGGSVDSADRATGPELVALAAQLDTDVVHAGRLACAAIRETFEEVGLLLTSPRAVAEPEQRRAVEAGELPISDLLTRLGVVADLTAIHPWARWITPPGRPRRFDTYFFVAAIRDEDLEHPVWELGASAAQLGELAVSQPLTTEASESGWLPIEQVFRENAAGSRPLMPPTFANLHEISRYCSTAEVLAAARGRTVSAVRQEMRLVDGALRVDLGDGRTFDMPDPSGVLAP